MWAAITARRSSEANPQSHCREPPPTVQNSLRHQSSRYKRHRRWRNGTQLNTQLLIHPVNMKLLIVLVVLVAAAAAEDQKAEESLITTTYAGHPLAYTAGYPYTYSAPAVYSSAYHPVAYSGLYNSFYHGYTAPVVHSLKKRDTEAAEEDQQPDESFFHSTYAAHPLTYTAGYPYTYTAPAVYSSAYHPVAYSGLYNSFYHGYTAPVVHSLKKRDTEAAEEDQQGEEALLYSSYAAHPLAYSAYPYRAPIAYSAYGLQTPASTTPLAYSAALPYAYHHAFY